MKKKYSFRTAICLFLIALTFNFAQITIAQERVAIIPVGKLPSSIAVNLLTSKAYVSNGLDQTISVIDGTNNTVTDTISVVRAGELAVNPITNQIYVGGLNGGVLSIIDGDTLTVTQKSLPVSECPCGVAVNSTTNRVYILHPRNNQLYVLDGNTNAILSVIFIGLEPHIVAVNEATNKVYVLQNSGYTDAGIVVLDGATNSIINNIPVKAEDMAFDTQTNFLYAVKDYPKLLYVIDGIADILTQTVVLDDFFGNIAVNSRTGRLYLRARDKIDIFDVATNDKAASVTGLLSVAGTRFTKTLASLDPLAKVFKVNRGASPYEAGANTVEVIQDIGAIDYIAPTTLISLDGVSGNAGWWIADATVTLSATDNSGGAGVALIEFSIDDGLTYQPYNSPFVITQEGTTKILARSTDNVGNIETPPKSVFVKIDKLLPTIDIASPQPQDYQHSDNISIQFSVADSVSGASTEQTAFLDGNVVTNGQSINLLSLSLGIHTLTITAFDIAGNSDSQSVSFNIIATIDSLISTVNILSQQGKITDTNLIKSLLAKLYEAKQALSRGNKKTASNKLMDFKDQVLGQTGKKITVDAASLLITDVDFVLSAI